MAAGCEERASEDHPFLTPSTPLPIVLASLVAVSLLSIFATYIFKAVEWFSGSTELYWSTSFMALALPATYLNTLYYMQGFDGHGPLVRIIIGCVQGVKAPAIIFAVTIVGFASAFFLLFEGQKNVDGESIQMSPWVSGLYTYTVMLAGFGVNDIDGSANSVVCSLLLICYTLFTYIIMINVLISVLSDDFDRIQENGKAEFTYARAEAVLEYETNLKAKDRINREVWPGKSRSDELRKCAL